MTQPTADRAQIMQLLGRALQHHQAGQAEQAEALYRQVLAAEPGNPDGLHLLGVLQGQLGKQAESLELLTRAVAVMPQVSEFHRHLGDTLAGMGRHTQALRSFLRAIQLAPRDPDPYTNAAAMLLALNRPDDAAAQLERAVKLAPNNGAVIGNWGSALGSAGRIDDSIRVLEHAVKVDPNCGPAWTQYAEALWRADRLEDALVAARRGVALAPNESRAHIMLGIQLQVLAQFDEAVAENRIAMRLDPHNPDPANNLGLTLLKMGRTRDALELLNESLQRWPNHVDMRANRSLAMLTLGDFEHGWPEYEMRWNSPQLRNYGRHPQPMWQGEDIAGKTMLLTMEQGVGDAIHFVRYAPLLAERGAKIIVSAREDIAPLIATVSGVSATTSLTATGVQFDLHAPMASLPGIFKTDLTTIPAKVPYINADPARVSRWRETLAPHAGLKVGLVWTGNPMHQNDRARSTTLAAFTPLARIEGVTFFSLQKGKAASQAKSPPAGMTLIDVSENLHDFADTAALLEVLDLLISVDTSVVHVAGALARPVWTLLPAGPDWRWLLDREDSPWYPTMRLFRQPQHGQWAPVFERVAIEMAKLISASH